MATKADEFEPEWRVVERVIQVALQPNMVACEEQRGFSMTGRLAVWAREHGGQSCVVSSAAINPLGAEAVGDIRLRFRKTYRPERVLFRIESIYPNLDPETGFTGFSVRGDLLITPEEVIVRPEFWTGHYNKLTWSGWV